MQGNDGIARYGRNDILTALNHIEAMECFEGTRVTIMDKMAASAFYAGIYTGVGLHTAMGDTGKLHKILDIALPELYAAVIPFAIKARQYFDARCKPALHMITTHVQRVLKKNDLGVKKAANMPKPFAIEFQPFIGGTTRKEKTVQECADMATMQRIRSMFISTWYICIISADNGPLRKFWRWRIFSLTCEQI